MDSTYPNTPKTGITHNSKTGSSKVSFKNLTSGHLGFLQITRGQVEFVGPDETKSTKTFIG